MYKIYDRLPEIAKRAYESEGIQVDLSGLIDHVILSGIGGSGSVGDIFSAILSKTNIHVNVVK